MLINVFWQSRSLTRVRVFVIFYNGDDRNDRNDKESEKSYVRAIARGLWISCHSCHLCHWGERNFLAYSGRTKTHEKTIAAYMLMASWKDEAEH